MHAIETAAALDPAFLDQLIEDIAAAAPGEAAEIDRRRVMARMALVAAKPADAMAAMLVAQALSAHYAAMDAYRRAAQATDDKLAARLRGNAATLARTMRANLKAADGRREPSEVAKPTRGRQPRSAPAAQGPAPAQIEAPAMRAPVLPRPTRRWEEMTMEERRAAFGYVHEGEESGEETAVGQAAT